jgi:hypothetical protein
VPCSAHILSYKQVLRYQLPSDCLHPHQAGVVPGYTARWSTSRGDSHVSHVACSSRNTNSPATATWPSVQTSSSVFEHIRGLAVRLRQCLITASASVPSQSTSTWPFRRSSYYPLLFPPQPVRFFPSIPHPCATCFHFDEQDSKTKHWSAFNVRTSSSRILSFACLRQSLLDFH